MTPEHWEYLSGWFTTWLGADAVERDALRSRLTADRPELTADADRLMAASPQLPGFLETPALLFAAQELTPDDPLLSAGSVVGPYRIVSLLARGGMGDVYRATDTRLHRDVALKVLSEIKIGDPRRVERFMYEARVTASLDHPNVVRVFDVGRFDDRAYLVAELLEGETLRSCIARGALPVDRVLRIGIEIASGLGAAHAAGLVHRDLKPENVFLTQGGATKLLDFGIAKLTQDEGVRDGFSTLTGVVLGTAGYLAPEQIRGEAIDARADLFALGAVLFEMLTAAGAFGREHIVDTLHAILHDDPRDTLAERADVPPALESVVMRLLQKSPDERFQRSADVIGALEGIASASAESQDRASHEITRRTSKPSPVRGTRAAADWAGGSTRPYQTRWAALTVAGVAVAIVAAVWQGTGPSAPRATDAPSVTLAVMPFRSIPATSESELLELGLADVFISRLGQLPEVRVLPLTATERLRQQDNPELAAHALGATHLLTGTLQREQGLVRATVQLVSARDNRTLWSTPVDADASRVFSIQDIIVSRVIEELAPQLTAGAKRRLAQAGTRRNEAFEAYLRGRAYVLGPTRSELTRAAASFEEALRLDPQYADAWAGLATTYRRMPVGGDGRVDWLVKAKEAATRALALVPDHSEAISALGTVAFWYDWDYTRAEQLLRRGRELQPSAADLPLSLAHLLSNLGRHGEALDEVRRARALDPASSILWSLEGQFLFMARRYEDALAHMDAMVKIDPRFSTGHVMRVYPLLALARYDEAVRECDEVMELRRRLDPLERIYPWAVALKGYALGRSGRHAEAEIMLAHLRNEARNDTAGEAYVTPYGEALILHAMRRDHEALERLTAAVDRREHRVTFLGVDPKWDALRSWPEFRALLSRVNLLEVSERIHRDLP